MTRLTALILSLLLVLPLAARAQEDSLIASYRTQISDLRDQAASAPALGVVRGRLSRAFIDNDIVFSRRYLDNWSLLLQDRWAQHDAFFTTQLDILSNWDQALTTGAVTRQEARAALAPAIGQIQVIADHIPTWLEDDTARMAERAFWTDMAQEIGCCDTLYYHALSEANAVWGVALSPDPAAIAALQILPSVPAPDSPQETTGERAFGWLASRAEGLTADGVASPARRRALLMEAGLLEELFGLPEEAGLDRSLTTLAIREGFAAQPVAPLVRMAALTEPGPLRDLLLDRAAARLERRADHLRPALQAATEAEGVPLSRSVALAAPPSRQMTGYGGGAGALMAAPAVPPAVSSSASSDAPANPTPAPSVARDSDVEAAQLVDDALAALLRAGPADPGLFIDIADMAERADALIGNGTTLDLVETLSTEAR